MTASTTAAPAAPPPLTSRDVPEPAFPGPSPIAPAATPRALLWRALGTRRRDLAVASVLYSSHQLGESMVPVVIGATVGNAVAGGDRWSIALWPAVLGADFLLLSLSYRFGARASMRAKQHTAHTVRMWVTERVVRPAGGIRLAPGDLLTRAASDAGRMGAFAGVFASIVAAVAVLAASTALLLRFSLPLGAVILAGTVLLPAVQDRVSRRLRRHSGTEQQEAGRAAVLAEDLIRGLRVLKGIGAEPTAAAEYRRASRGALKASLRAVSSESVLTAVGTAFTGAYLAVIAGVGGWLALSGRLGLGEFVAALGLARFVIGPMRVVSAASAAYARALASAARVREVLTAEAAVEVEVTASDAEADAEAGARDARTRTTAGVAAAAAAAARTEAEAAAHAGTRTGTEARAASEATAAPDASAATGARTGRVTFEGADGFTFTAEAGALTGVVVAEPALAARIPALLARERDPAAGRIRVDGVDIAALPLAELRGRVLVSPHDAVLFPGTIAENIGLLAPDEAAARRGAWAAFADQVIATVPDGARTPVGDRGENLSGGQRQRVALARALAADPPVLVLHDPTTAVDAATEDRVAERLRQVRSGRTSLVVTTSPALLSRCDRVVFVHDARDNGDGKGGAAVATGSHAELMRGVPAYRELLTK